jgi:hypothetical protein
MLPHANTQRQSLHTRRLGFDVDIIHAGWALMSISLRTYTRAHVCSSVYMQVDMSARVVYTYMLVAIVCELLIE